jgi:hypothetical protein
MASKHITDLTQHLTTVTSNVGIVGLECVLVLHRNDYNICARLTGSNNPASAAVAQIKFTGVIPAIYRCSYGETAIARALDNGANIPVLVTITGGGDILIEKVDGSNFAGVGTFELDRFANWAYVCDN